MKLALQKKISKFNDLLEQAQILNNEITKELEEYGITIHISKKYFKYMPQILKNS